MLGLGSSITGGAALEDVLPALVKNNPYLQLWLKHANGLTHDGSTLSAWDDESGRGNHATQSTASRQPDIDAGDTIDFNISADDDERLQLTSSITLGEFTIIVACDTAHSSAAMGLMGSASDECLKFHQGGDPDRISLLLPSTTAEDADMFDLSANIPFRTPFIFTMVRSTGPNDNVSIRFDGTDVTDLTAAARNDSDPANTFTFNDIGAVAGNLNNWRGHINEVVVFNTGITDTTLLASIESEISTRVA